MSVSTLRRAIGFSIRKTDALLRPWLFRREKKEVLKRFPQLEAVLAEYESRYIRVEYGAHDLSLMERIQRNMTDKDEFVYGYTPWRTFLKVADALQVQADDVFIEPGCGIGHLCFLMNQAYGIPATGFESIANFVTTANEIREKLSQPPQSLNFSGLQFYNLDFFNCDMSRGTLFYIAGTCFPDDYRKALIDKIISEARPGSKLITLSHELEADLPFRLLDSVEAFFSWGRDKALIYELSR